MSNPIYLRALDAHVAAFAGARDSGSVLFEFGAGSDLFSSFYLHSRGFPRQIVVDLERNVYPDALNSLVAAADFVGDKSEFTADFASELLSRGIVYMAPYDVRECQLADHSISYICTTNTLEHIPEADLRRILAQCRRILRPDGVMSMWIDYSDHYSHSDPAISAYNFLQFSAERWAPHNSHLQFQNRLRHGDYRCLFVEAGFEVTAEMRFHADDWQQALDRIEIDEEFRNVSREELGATGGHFILRPIHRVS